MDFHDVIAIGSMTTIFFKNLFPKDSFSAIYVADLAYAFKALLKKSWMIFVHFLRNLLAIAPTEINVSGN